MLYPYDESGNEIKTNYLRLYDVSRHKFYRLRQLHEIYHGNYPSIEFDFTGPSFIEKTYHLYSLLKKIGFHELNTEIDQVPDASGNQAIPGISLLLQQCSLSDYLEDAAGLSIDCKPNGKYSLFSNCVASDAAVEGYFYLNELEVAYRVPLEYQWDRVDGAQVWCTVCERPIARNRQRHALSHN